MGLFGFSNNRNVLGGSIKQPPINSTGDCYNWNTLVTKALDAVHGKNVFDGKSYRGPVKVIVTSLDGFINDGEFNSTGIKNAPKGPYVGYNDAHISVLRSLIANKLKDPYIIDYVEKHALEGFQIIYGDNRSEFNDGIDDLIHSISVHVNEIVGDYDMVAKRLAVRHETDMIEVADEFNSWVQQSKEFQEILRNLKKKDK